MNALHVRALDWNRAAIAWAEANGRPLVGNGDVHRLIQLGLTWSEVDVDLPPEMPDAERRERDLRSDPRRPRARRRRAAVAVATPRRSSRRWRWAGCAGGCAASPAVLACEPPAFLVACPDADTILLDGDAGRAASSRSRHTAPARRPRRRRRRPRPPRSPPSPQAEAYLDAVRKGDVAAVEKALAAGVAVDTPFRYNRTALSFAADRGHVEVVRLLLAKGANPDATDSFYNQSSLGWASSPAQTRRPEHAEVVKLLLEKGAKGRERALGAAIGADDVRDAAGDPRRRRAAAGAAQRVAGRGEEGRQDRDRRRPREGRRGDAGGRDADAGAAGALSRHLQRRPPGRRAVALKDGALDRRRSAATSR